MPLGHSGVLGAGVPAAPGQWSRSPSATGQLAGRQLSGQQPLVLPGLLAPPPWRPLRCGRCHSPGSQPPQCRGTFQGGTVGRGHTVPCGCPGHWSGPGGRLESRVAASPPQCPASALYQRAALSRVSAGPGGMLVGPAPAPAWGMRHHVLPGAELA